MPQTRKKCKKCGSQNFIVQEQYTWDAFTDESDKKDELHCVRPDSCITLITCRDCDTEHKEFEFNQINFN